MSTDIINKIEREQMNTDIGSFNVGDTVSASVNIKSNEFNGKYYTSVNAWQWNNKNSESNEGFVTTDDDVMPF